MHGAGVRVCLYLGENGWFKDADVAVVKASRDGGDNSHWQKHGQAYQALVQAVKNACGAVDRSRYSKVTFSGLLYLQGESNTGTSVPESASRFLELLNDLSADLKPYGDTSALAAQKAIIGENANWDGRNETDAETGNITGGLEGRDTTVQGKTTQQVMKSLAASRPGMGYAPTRDLPKLTAGDTMGVHYSGLPRSASVRGLPTKRPGWRERMRALSAVAATMFRWERRKHG